VLSALDFGSCLMCLNLLLPICSTSCDQALLMYSRDIAGTYNPRKF